MSYATRKDTYAPSRTVYAERPLRRSPINAIIWTVFVLMFCIGPVVAWFVLAR